MTFVKHNIKKSLKYKEVRSILNDLFGSADFRDNIEDGVSFKWYLHQKIKRMIPNYDGTADSVYRYLIKSNLKDKILMENIEIKVLGPSSYTHSWRGSGYESLRILVRF
jgi:hypothetical protein